MLTPKISIITPVYNGKKYLREAINSILQQTYKNFEFIIINDASTDRTLDIVSSFDDQRIKIINNENNVGITKSLNVGVKAARGKYIARMDADDVSLPERLKKQADCLDKNPNIAVIGSAIKLIDEKGDEKGKKLFPSTPLLVKWKLLFGFVLAHPTIMSRAEVMKSNPYNESYINSQDYELWSHLVFQTGVNISNLPEYLFKYREHAQTASRKKPIDRIKRSANIGINNIKKYHELNAHEEKLILQARLGQLKLFELLQEKKLVKLIAGKFIAKENPSESEKKEINKFSCAHFMFNLKAVIKDIL